MTPENEIRGEKPGKKSPGQLNSIWKIHTLSIIANPLIALD